MVLKLGFKGCIGLVAGARLAANKEQLERHSAVFQDCQGTDQGVAAFGLIEKAKVAQQKLMRAHIERAAPTRYSTG